MATLAPIVSWVNKDDLGDLQDATLFDAGVVDAGSISGEHQFYLFNNKGNSTEAVYDMQQVRITSKDTDGGMQGVSYSSEVVEGKWLEVKSISNGDTDFTAVGADYDPIASDYTEVSHYVGANGATISPTDYKIGGGVNDGTLASTDNFVDLILRVNIPSSALAGRYDYRTRVRYSFGSS